MITLIDMGNSNLKLYSENNNKPIILKNNKSKAIHKDLSKITFGNKVLIVSVVPSCNIFLEKEFDDRQIQYEFININHVSDLKLGHNNYKTSGIDRLVAIYGAMKYGSNFILFNFGTGITIEVIVDDIYKTGFIVPGPNIMIKSLIESADLIEDFEYVENLNLDIITTNDAINCGVTLMYEGMINNILYKMTKKYNKNFQIIIGGTFLENKINQTNWIYNNNLIYEGIKKIKERKIC